MTYMIQRFNGLKNKTNLIETYRLSQILFVFTLIL
jgi:hypothetical protein